MTTIRETITAATSPVKVDFKLGGPLLHKAREWMILGYEGMSAMEIAEGIVGYYSDVEVLELYAARVEDGFAEAEATLAEKREYLISEYEDLDWWETACDAVAGMTDYEVTQEVVQLMVENVQDLAKDHKGSLTEKTLFKELDPMYVALLKDHTVQAFLHKHKLMPALKIKGK